MEAQDAKDLLDAARTLVKQNVGDYIYSVRERALEEVSGAMSTWEAPSVKAWGAACATLERIVKKYGP